MSEDVEKHVSMLISLDDETYSEMTYSEMKALIEDDVQSLISLGSKATDKLCTLLQEPYTWSCLFSLEILKEIKDPKAISHLIDFIKNNEDNSDCAETAMLTLSNIGTDAIEPLIHAIDEDFSIQNYNSFLAGSLTRIIDPKVYSFMNEIARDYVSNPQKYKDWFQIEDFTFYCVEHKNKEMIPLLNTILQMEELAEHQRIELQDTIRVLDNPEKYEEEVKEEGRQIDKIINEIYWENDADEESDIDFYKHPQSNGFPHIEKTDIYTIVNDKKEPIIINEGNRERYFSLLIPIEKSIADEYAHDSSLKDRDVIPVLKHIRDYLFKKDYTPNNTLETIIVNNLKLAIIGNDYSKFEVKACVKYVYNSVKRHKNVDGKQGYVKFISSTLGEQ